MSPEMRSRESSEDRVGKEDSMELEDYRKGNRFRDFDAEWEEVDLEDDVDDGGEEEAADDSLVFEEVAVDELGRDKYGNDIVEMGMPLKSDAKRKKEPREVDAEKTKKERDSGLIRVFVALKKLKVASSETCENLLSTGFVTVNDKKVVDKNYKVDLEKDLIKVNGRVMNKRFLQRSGSRGRETEQDDDRDDESMLPRGHRDFNKSGVVKKKEDGESFRPRDIDGGFFASKARKSKPRK